MLNKHMWERGAGQRWRSKEERRCLKCGSYVQLVAVPRGGSRLFAWMDRTGRVVHGAGKMPDCRPADQNRGSSTA